MKFYIKPREKEEDKHTHETNDKKKKRQSINILLYTRMNKKKRKSNTHTQTNKKKVMRKKMFVKLSAHVNVKTTRSKIMVAKDQIDEQLVEEELVHD